MASSLHTVDVVIPCYNYGYYLAGCVQSVLTQTGVEVRVLIIDDHSSDNSAEIAQALAATDRRVAFRRHEVNMGHIATFNEGIIGWSTGEYSALLSADDLLAPGALMRAVQIMEINLSIGMVYGHAAYFEKNDDISGITRPQKGYRVWPGAGWIENLCRVGHNVISSPEVLVRGSVQRTVGGYRIELPHTGDLEMWLRIAACTNIAYVRGAPQAYYRVHSASMQRTQFRRKISDLEQRKAAFDIFIEDHRHTMDGADHLHELALRALAREALWEACRAYDRNEVEEAGANELVQFAVSAYPAAKYEAEYSALLRRRKLGAPFCRCTQLFALPAISRRVHGWLQHEHWKRHGV